MRRNIYFVLIFIQSISTIYGDTDEIKILPEEFCAVANAMNFHGKVVIVSGSSSGIGAATVRLFSYLGARVVVTGRNETRINQVVDDCRKSSPNKLKPLGIKLDLTIPGNVGRLVNETIRAFKKIDILVNCAGIGNFATVDDTNFNKIYREVRAINVDAGLELTRLATPYIRSTNGSVIFIGSILARNPVQSTGAYSMSKNAIISLAMTLAHDLGPNCRVNVISPSIVDGTRIFRLMDPSLRSLSIESAIKSTTLKRSGVPMDIAKLVIFLSSNLSTSLNGQEIRADQGAYIPL